MWLSSLRWSSKSESQAKVDLRTGPYERCTEVGHVTGSIDLRCDQLGCSIYSEDVVLYLSCHHGHLGNHLKGETKKSSHECLGYPQNAETKLRWRNGAIAEQKPH